MDKVEKPRKKKRRERALQRGKQLYSGRPTRGPDTGTHGQLQRQHEAYEYHLRGHTNRSIARQLGVHEQTIALDLKMESQRRANEFVDDRAEDTRFQIQVLLQQYQRSIERARVLEESAHAVVQEKYIDPVTGQERERTRRETKDARLMFACAAHEKIAAAALGRIADIKGLLTQPSVMPQPEGRLPLLIIMEALDPESRVKVIRALRDAAIARGLPLPAPLKTVGSTVSDWSSHGRSWNARRATAWPPLNSPSRSGFTTRSWRPKS